MRKKFIEAMKQKIKRALLEWMGLYPIITLMLYAFGGFLHQLPLAVETLVLTMILVPLMSFVVMPKILRLFEGWIEK